MANAYYVYGIQSIASPPPAGIAGFEGAPVMAIRCRALAAAASLVDARGVRPMPESLMKHEEVVEALQSAGPLLPARFGTVLPSADAVVEAMTKQYAAFLADLGRVGGKVELGLAVLWSADGEESGEGRGGQQRCDATSGPGSAGVSPARDAQSAVTSTGSGEPSPTSPVGEGTRYLRGRLVEFQREEILRARAQSLARDIEDRLGRLAVESNYAVLPTPRLAIRAAYLVERSQTEAFRGAFDELRGARPGLHFLLSGPWPPYSFVTRQQTSLG